MILKAMPDWWGGPRHRVYTICVFVILASLDNAARTVFPPLYAVVARDLNVAEAALGAVTASGILVVAITAVVWGYWGDRGKRGNRKLLLMFGTGIWSTAMMLASQSTTYEQLFALQLVAAVGIGGIAAIGFSMMTDLVSPARRGLSLSLWALSQGVLGGGGGSLLGSTLGAYNWRLPFMVIAGAGILFAVLFVFSYEPRRGQSEPALARLFARAEGYQYRIALGDLRQILRRRTNLMLILQGLVATFAGGSLIWMPRLYIARVEALGYPLETATVVGNLLALLLQMGFYFAVVGGHWGDLWQRRTLRGRTLLCTITLLSAIPFLMALFFWPLPALDIPDQGSVSLIMLATLTSIFTNGWVAGAFVLALVGIALLAVDAPNRAALLIDVNLPEHRATVAGITILTSGIGAALGNALAGVLFTYLAAIFPAPQNYAVGLAVFQLFFLPAGLLYFQMMRTVGPDIVAVRTILAERGKIED